MGCPGWCWGCSRFTTAGTAREAPALDRLHPDRLRLCIGHGIQPWMQMVGAAASPLTLLREYAVALRGLLAGDRVTADGMSGSTGVRLDHPSKQPLPVQVGAAAGGPDDLAEALGQLGRGGLTAVIAQPTGDDPDLDGLVRMLGSDVRATLAAA